MTIEIAKLTGNIGQRPEVKMTNSTDPSKPSRQYYFFRLAVTHGEGEKKWTDWYSVRAFIDEVTGDLLDKGQLVSIKGTLLKNKFIRGDSTEAIEQVVLANEVTTVPRKKPVAA